MESVREEMVFDPSTVFDPGTMTAEALEGALLDTALSVSALIGSIEVKVALATRDRSRGDFKSYMQTFTDLKDSLDKLWRMKRWADEIMGELLRRGLTNPKRPLSDWARKTHLDLVLKSSTSATKALVFTTWDT